MWTWSSTAPIHLVVDASYFSALSLRVTILTSKRLGVDVVTFVKLLALVCLVQNDRVKSNIIMCTIVYACIDSKQLSKYGIIKL